MKFWLLGNISTKLFPSLQERSLHLHGQKVKVSSATGIYFGCDINRHQIEFFLKTT